MRGLIIAVQCSRARCRSSAVHRLLQAVVDDDVVELVLRAASSSCGDLQAALDLLGVVGAAARQAVAQRLGDGGRDEDLDRLGHRLADLPRALDLDLQHDGTPPAVWRSSSARSVP